jgi:RHS repeat-associated protein
MGDLKAEREVSGSIRLRKLVAGISFLLLLVLTAGTGQAVPTRTGHSLTGATVLTKIYGPDTSGQYGGSQGKGWLLGVNSAGIIDHTRHVSFRGRAADVGGHVYMGARYYDANTRTFLSADPLDYNAGINLYSYAAGDPINFTDPDGRIAKGALGGATLGDYYQAKNFAQGFGQFVGQTATSFVPIAGQAADVRDFTAALGAVRSDGLNWRTGTGLAVGVFAFAPGIGDAAKAIAKPFVSSIPSSATAQAVSTFGSVATSHAARTEGLAYRAINPQFAESTAQNGFFRSGAPGRLGNDGIYANTTPQGAIAEFQFHNPGVTPAVFEVNYPLSSALRIDPPSGYFSQPLPFTGGANILQAPSLRAPGTQNFLIREGATPGLRLQ